MVLLTQKRKLLWFGHGKLPANVLAAVSRQWDITACEFSDAPLRRLDEADLVLASPPCDGRFDIRVLSDFLDRVDRSGVVAVVFLPAGVQRDCLLSRRKGQFIVVDAGAEASEITARIESAAALQPVIRNLQDDVAAVRSLAAGGFEELDEEMRLAARLQRDFLPRSLPRVGPVRFAALFRPAEWVSGDIYDVFRLDENNVGFYVADVVGHGMPAALLTMFVKKALQTKRIAGNRYEIISPEDALAGLNADIYGQELSSCPFCTVVYGIVDTRSLTVRYARGGHPCPLLLHADGAIGRLEAVGPLLGIFPDEAFEEREIQLNAGDRLIVFSDGLEEALSCSSPVLDDSELITTLQGLSGLPAEGAVLELAAMIDDRSFSNRCNDDVTALIMDVLDPASPDISW